MPVANQTAPAGQAPIALVSTILFAPGDEVKSKSEMLPFWMTITSVNERTGYCQCYFGSSGNYAGNFHHSELRFNGGRQFQQLAG